jgi:Transposase DDE domain
LQGYNAQAVVSEDHVILAARITQDSIDLHQLHPMLQEARANLVSAQIPKRIGVALADSGYYSEANLEVAEQEDPELLVAVMNERDQRRGEVSGRGVFAGRRGRVMQGKLATERGRGLYAKRATPLSRCSATSGGPQGQAIRSTRPGRMRRRMEAALRHAQPPQAVAALQDLST